MKLSRRLITILTATALFAASLFGPADWGVIMRGSALNPEGLGTEAEPFIVDEASDFINIMNRLPSDTQGKHYRQEADFAIDVSTYDYAQPFQGHYDGNGYQITVTNSGTYQYLGGLDALGGVFYSVASGASVKNLNVDLNVILEGRAYFSGMQGENPSRPGNAFISGSDYFGGIAGKSEGTITNCAVTGNIKMTQRYGRKYVSDPGEYDATETAESKTFVGGVVGYMGGGTVEGCYSGVTIRVGSSSADKYPVEYERSSSNLTKDVKAYYDLRAGGFVGEMANGTLKGNLAENVNVYIGNATDSGLEMNWQTRTYIGGFIGYISGNSTVQYNLRRGGHLNADIRGSGSAVVKSAAGQIAGLIAPGVSTSSFTNNFAPDTQSLAQRNGWAWYQGNGDDRNVDFNSYTSGNYGLILAARPSIASLDKGIWAEIRDGLPPDLKWRSLSAPSVPANFSSGVNTIATGSNPLIEAGPPAKIVIELNPTALENPRRKGSPPLGADKIRYQLSVTGGSQYAAPEAKVGADKTTIELTPPSGATASWGKGATGAINETGNIDISAIPSGVLQTYRIQSQGNGNVADSKIRTITVTRTQTMPSGISPASIVLAIEAETPFTPGTLATPKVALHEDGDKLTLTHESPALSRIAYVWRQGQNVVNIKPTESLTDLDGLYTVTAEDRSGVYKASSPLEVTITPTSGGSGDWTVATDNVNTEVVPVDDTPPEPGEDASEPGEDASEPSEADSGDGEASDEEGGESEAIVPAAIVTPGILATPTVTPIGTTTATELSVTYGGAADSSAYEIRWGRDSAALTTEVPTSLTGLSGVYYAQTVAVNTTEYTDSGVLTVTITPPDNSGDGWKVTPGAEVPGTPFTKGKLATPQGVYDIPNKTITLSYPGPKAEGVTFEYGTTEALGSTGSTIKPVEPVNYYVQSIDNSGLYEDSNVLTVPLTANTVTVDLVPLGNDNDFNGKTQGETTVYTYANNIHDLVGNSMVLTATGMDLGLGSKITLEAWMDGERAQSVTKSFSAPGGTPTPLITPGSDGSLVNGIEITSSVADAKIYYTIRYDGSEPPDPVEGESERVEGKTIPWSELEPKFTGSTLRVKAIAKGPGNAAYSAVTEAVYTVANKPQPDGVRLRIDNGDFDSSRYYPPGSEVHFDPQPGAGETIRYTTTGETPTATVGSTYDPAKPHKLPPAMSFVDIKAYLQRDNFPDSPILSERVLILAEHGKPLFSLEQNAEIASGQTLAFLPEPNDLPEEIRPKYYLLEGDASGTPYTIEEVRNVPGSYYGVIELDFSEQGSFQYADYAGLIPTLNYTVNGGGNKTYTFGVPEIRFVRDTVEVSGTRKPHTPAEKIPLIGNPDETVTVMAYLDSKNESRFADGEPETRNFLLQAAAAPPEARPSPSDRETVRVGETIALTTKTTGAQIFYSTLGFPQVRWNGSGYEAVPDTNTEPYDMTKGIKVQGLPEDYYTIYALACRSGLAASEPVAFTYRISALDQVSAPVAYPSTTLDSITTVEQGGIVILTSSTPGSVIFYSETGLPEVTVTETAPGSGSYSYSAANGSTKPYTPGGIQVTGNPGSTVTFSAVAMRSGMADSSVVMFTYRIAALPKLEAPKATPSTSSDSVSIVQPGASVLLTCSTADASIYYRIGGTPVVTKNADGSYSPGSGALLYDPSGGIKIDGNAGAFVTVAAIAAKAGTAPSDIAVFPYQLPAPVQSVYASPSAGEVVKGTAVELSTTTEGATIYYEVETGGDDADDAEPFVSPKYSSPIVINEETSITAVAEKDGVVSAVMSYEYTVSDQIEAPVPNIPGGSVVPRGTKITLTTKTPGTTITYTKDGSDPTKADNKNRMHGAEVSLDAEEGKSVSLNAYATKTGMTPSETVTLSYTIAKAEEVFTANPPSGSIVKPGDLITLTSSVTDAKIHYTTDGSDPTIYSSAGNSVTVTGGYGETFVIRAVAAFHEALSVPQVFTYTILGQAAAPSASIPNGAVIMAGAKVSLSAPEGTVHYTLDGSEPNTSSPMFTEPIALTGSVVLKAVAVAEGKAMSPVAEYIYTMAGQVAAPTASSPSGPLVAGTQITLTSTTEGASIYYSTDGTDPSEDNLGNLFPYEAPLTISRPVTIKMFAVKTGLHTSVINTVTYTVQDPPPPPEETAEEESDFQMDSDKLFLFDQFLGADSGPLFSDIVLRDPVTQVVLSTNTGIVPEGVQLVTNQNPAPTSEHNENAMRALDLRLESVYDISLVYNSEEVQPSQPKSVEIGLPIPEGYEDTVVIVCHISDNGTVSGFPTRRSGGIAYAVVDHFSKFAVAVPPYAEPLAAGIPWQTILFSVPGLAAAGVPTGLFLWKRRQKKNNTTQTEKRS